MAVMEVPPYESGGDNYYMAHIIDRAQTPSTMPQREVRLRSLDSLLGEKAQKVAFIKCDVEGHELSLVKGAQKLVEMAKAAWLIEVSRTSNPDLEGSNSWDIFSRFSAHGHSPWWLDGNVFRRRKHGDQTLNYFFLSPQHVTELRLRSSLEIRE